MKVRKIDASYWLTQVQVYCHAKNLKFEYDFGIRVYVRHSGRPNEGNRFSFTRPGVNLINCMLYATQTRDKRPMLRVVEGCVLTARSSCNKSIIAAIIVFIDRYSIDYCYIVY